jgi:hypothetical protein
MIAEIFTVEQDAIDRALVFHNETKDHTVSECYCAVMKHPTENKWAVPCSNTGLKAVTNTGVELTSDWWPEDPLEV